MLCQEEVGIPNDWRASLAFTSFDADVWLLQVPSAMRSGSGRMLKCGLGSFLSHLKSSISSHWFADSDGPGTAYCFVKKYGLDE